MFLIMCKAYLKVENNQPFCKVEFNKDIIEFNKDIYSTFINHLFAY